jgi:uncharacterized protein YbcI
VLNHVGLLFNEPPGTAGLPFIKSSENLDRSRRNVYSNPRYSAPQVTGIRGFRFCRLNVSPVPGTDRYAGQVRDVAMKTQGEIEAAICEGIRRFEQEFMGRGPKDIHSYLVDDLIVIRLQGVLTAAEQQLVESLPTEKGRDLLKQVRIQLIETARPVLESMVLEVTGVKVVSLHHDISTTTGEEIVAFTLAESPLVREKKKR